ncbi:MAG: MGH1-like glycoside hydrolase domain-containing protein [Christensenellales bacterium]|jgi:hypothetical protein
MKYINREYGFKGRPPYFPDFYEETDKGAKVTSADYPRKYYVGAGLNPSEPYGAMLIGANGTRWGIRISCNIRGRWIDSESYLNEIGRLYAVSRDGNFTYFAYGDLTATVVRYSKRALVMSIATVDSIKIRISFYLQEPVQGEIREAVDAVKGAARHLAVIPGDVSLDDQMSVFRERYEVICDNEEREYFTAKAYIKPLEITSDDRSVTYEYELEGRNSRLFIYAAVGGKEIFDRYPEESELIEGTSMEEIAYSTTKTIGRGALGRCANGFINSSLYHRIYNPLIKDMMYIESRTAIDKNFAFKGSDLNAATIIASYIGDFETARAQCELAYTDEILGPLALWTLYMRTRDRELVKRLYKYYSSRYIPKGALIISDDKYEVSYCMPGSPLKEENIEKPMYSLDKSCINLLNMDIMERLALITGAPENSLYAESKRQLIDKINDLLWNPKLGIYMNRYLDGNFASSYGITSFYPLIAGAVKGLDKLERLTAALRDRKKFYGDKMIPTLSKDHPEYGVKFTDHKGNTVMPYSGYRGMIVPYMNFLVYQGLSRYGVYDLMADIAAKSANTWYSRYKKGNYDVFDTYLPGVTLTINDSFRPDTENVLKGAEKHSLSGNLMALIGLCELIDVEYFRDDLKVALRFGTMLKGTHSVSRLNVLGRLYSVSVTDRGMLISADNSPVLSGEGGKFIIRQYTESNKGAEFIVLNDNDIILSLALPIIGFCEESQSLTFTLQAGASKVKIIKGKPRITKIY